MAAWKPEVRFRKSSKNHVPDSIAFDYKQQHLHRQPLYCQLQNNQSSTATNNHEKNTTSVRWKNNWSQIDSNQKLQTRLTKKSTDLQPKSILIYAPTYLQIHKIWWKKYRILFLKKTSSSLLNHGVALKSAKKDNNRHTTSMKTITDTNREDGPHTWIQNTLMTEIDEDEGKEICRK